MLKKLGLVDLHQAIQTKIEGQTGLPCYDQVPHNAPAPFYFVQVVGKTANDTKTMWREVFTVWIHAIARKKTGNVQVYQMIENLEEALTEEVTLPDYARLLRQVEQGIQTIQTDETGEKHAVLEYEFMITYGFKAKI